MDLSEEVFYILIFLAVAFNLLFVALVVAYLRLVKRHLTLETKLKEYTLETDKVMARAQKEAQGIITDAHHKASSIISQTQDFTGKYESKMGEEFAKAQEAYKAQYGKAIGDIQKESIQMIQNISKEVDNQFAENRSNMTKAMEEEFESLRGAIDSSIKSLMDELSKAVEEERVKARDEFEAQKANKLAHLNEEIESSVKGIVKDVLNSVITLRDQNKIVMESLEKAKKEGKLDEN